MAGLNTGPFEFDYLFEDNPLNTALADLGVFAFDVDSRKVLCSSLWRACGYGDEEMLKTQLLEICHPDDREIVKNLLDQSTAGVDEEHSAIFRIRTASGGWVWLLHRGRVVTRTSGGTLKLYVGTDTDLSPIKEKEEELRLSKIETEMRAREAETLQKAAAVIATSLEINETVRLILEQAAVVVPFEKASVQILTSEGLEIIGGHGFLDMEQVLGLRFPYPEPGSMSTTALQERRPVLCGDLARDFPRFVETEALNPTMSWMGIPLVAHGDVIGLLSFDHTDRNFFTEQHLALASGFAVHVAIALENARLHERIQRLAMEDALMEIGSRHCFNIQGRALYEDSRRRKSDIALAMMDVDFFKKVNDVYGHDVGDQVLKVIGQLCRQQLRISDLVARFGGEEVVFLFPDTGEDIAFRVMERLRQVIGQYDFPDLKEPVTISTGISSEIPSRDSTLQDLIRRADAALYTAKHSGRNRTVISRPE